jgi:CHASE2 domain-containing sensor protein
MKKLITRGILVTAFVFLTMWGVSGLGDLKMFSAFDPISQALGEFELTDYVFSTFRDPPKPDNRIILINISQASRREIAQAVSIISQHKPKVIGIDSFFDCEGGLYDTINCPELLDTLGNLMLGSAIQQAGNVVMVSRLMQTDSLFKTDAGHVFDSIEYSDPIFSDYAKNAFANLPTGDRDGNNAATYQEDVKICKYVVPSMNVKGKEVLAFSVQMAMLYDSVKTQNFLDRGNFDEVINFRGNINISDVRVKSDREQMASVSEFNSLCFAIDWIPFTEAKYDPSIFENNIVILGYLGDYFGDPAWEDKFFTPLNSKVAGRANPDMFGPVIHANIVAMILNEDYIDEIPFWVQVIIALVVCFLNVLLFMRLEVKLPFLYDGLSFVIQIFELLIVALIIIYVFAFFNYKLELSLTMAALALIGPCFDIFKGIENTYTNRLTSKHKEVLTTQNAEIS